MLSKKEKPTVPQVRHRIHELFSQKDLDKFVSIMHDPKFTNNNDKFDAVLEYLTGRDFVELGCGTNRMAVKHGDYVYKIALDSYGIKDNWTEFEMSPELQPYVTKTYECNGYVAVAEYVNLFSKEEFVDSRDNIRNILENLAEDYLFCDMGTVAKNYLNFGFRDDETIVVLDYGYVYRIDRKIMRCLKCYSELRWNADFSSLICVKCGRKHSPIDIRDRMRKKAEYFDAKPKHEGMLVFDL